MKKKAKKTHLQGDFADVEDGRVVLFHVDRDALRGYGVVRVTRYPTDLRASHFDADAFPAPCVYGGLGWSIVFQVGGRPVRHQVSPDLIDYRHGSSTKTVLDERDLTGDEVNNRWRHLRYLVNSAGKLVVLFARSKLPRGYKSLTSSWAEAILKGASEDAATDILYDAYGVELANDFLRAVSTPSRAYGCPPDSLFVLEGASSKGHVPLAWAGTVPDVDWTGENY